MPAPAGKGRLPQARRGMPWKKLTKLWREVTGGRGGWRALLPVRTLLLPSDTPCLPVPPQNPGLVEQYLSAISAWSPARRCQACWGCWCSSARATRRWT